MSDPIRMILRGIAAALNSRIEVVERRSTDWASVTFTGGRHHLRLRSWIDPSPLIATIEEIDFPPHDHLVADIILGEILPLDDGWQFEVEALTVEIVAPSPKRT